MLDERSIAEALAVADEYEAAVGYADNDRLLNLIMKGCEASYREIFGDYFWDGLDSEETDDKHHTEAIFWHWAARIGLIQYELKLDDAKERRARGEINPIEYRELKTKLEDEWFPLFWAYFAIWSRGNMKTTILRRVIVMDALMSVAFGVGGYALVVGGTVKKVRGTATSVHTLLQTAKVKQYAPALSRVKKNDQGASQGWTADFINTEAGYIFHFIGLDQGIAGANVDDLRPTFICPDDVDDREDSVVISNGRFETLTRSVIGTKQWNTLFFFAQNLISRYAVLYRIVKQHVRVLANRYVTEPIPAVRDLVTEQRTVNGIIKDIAVSGKPTWQGWDMREVQNQIDSMTLPIFMMECQHDVEQNRVGLILHKYDDNVHPISYSQFAAVYRSPDAWKDWYKVLFSDYARTKTQFHASVSGYLAVSSQNTKLAGHTFLIPFSFKADTMAEDMAERWLAALQPYAYERKTWRALINEAWKRLNPNQHFEDTLERLNFLKSYYSNLIYKYGRAVLRGFNVRASVLSHSEDKLRDSLNTGFGFDFIPSNPGQNDAIEDINTAMRVDYKEADPFRPGAYGYTRFHVLCADNLDAEPTIINGMEVYPPVPYKDDIRPDDLHDELLFRYQMLNCRFRPEKVTVAGQEVDVPEKLNDDFKQGLQMVYFKKLLKNIALSLGEKVAATVEVRIPESLVEQARESGDEDYAANLVNSRRMMESKVREQIGKAASPPKPSWTKIG